MPSIEETVTAAFDAAGTEEEAPEVEEAPEAVEAAPEEDDAPEVEASPSRARDEAGKFAKESKKPADKPAPAKASGVAAGQAKAGGAATPLPAPLAEPVSAEPAVKAPASMTLAEREAFSRAPPEVQRFLDRRERDQSKVVAEAAEARKHVQRLQETIAPHADFLRNNGMDPFQTMGGLLGDARVIWHGSPQAKAAKIAQMIGAAGVDIGLLDQMLSGQAPAQGQQQQGDPVAAARQAAREEYQQMIAQAHQQQTQQRSAAFAAKHEWLQDERLGPQVRKLMDAARDAGVAADDESAYALAINAHPEIAPVEQQKKAAKSVTTAQAATAQAKAAASSVKGRPGLQMDGPKPKGIRAQVEAAFDAHER